MRRARLAEPWLQVAPRILRASKAIAIQHDMRLMTAGSNDASVRISMLSILAAFDFEQINSGVYFAAATVLIFTAGVLAGRRVNQQLPMKWLVGIAGLAFITLALIWLLVSALNRKEATPPSPPPDYPAATGSP